MRRHPTVHLRLLLCAGSLLAPRFAVAAQVNFTVTVIDTVFPGTSWPTDVRAADVDGDGLLDILVAAPDFAGSDDALLWYANEGNGSFTRTVVDASPWNPARLDVADLDGDLDQDLVVASGDSLHRYTNDGSGVFIRDKIDFIGAIRIPSIGDLDGDTDLDIAVLSNDGVFWEVNDGLGVFTRDTLDLDPVVDQALAVTDLDDDGDQDVIAAIYVGTNSIIMWYRNDGAGTFTERQLYQTPDNTADLVVDDYDRDGDKDFVTAEIDRNRVLLYRNDGSENFAQTLVSPDTTKAPSGAVVADLDRDVDRDVVAVGGLNSLGEVMYYENSGASVFSRKPIDTDPGSRQRVAATDMDGDSDADLLVVNTSPDQLVLYTNLGTGTSVAGGAGAGGAARVALDQNEPNPFGLGTEIRFRVGEIGPVSLSIYNVAGELVRTLAAGEFRAGAHAVSWDGRDGDGRVVAAGTYLYRLDATGDRLARKMVLVR